MERRYAIILFILGAGAFLYLQWTAFSNEFLQEKPKSTLDRRIVTKVIDGDTIIVSGGDTIRMLGIDTDEKGQPCYAKAKDHLYELLINKEVTIEQDGPQKDLYKRLLRYVFLRGENVNERMVREGYAVARLAPTTKKYNDVIRKAESEAILNNVGCKWGTTPT